jgi:flagellar hook assembly protein FlgD
MTGSSGAVEIAFLVPRQGRYKVDVYDIAGRKIRSVADAVFGSGANRVTWNGRRENGARCASGIFLVRVAGDGESVTGKIVLAH